MLLIVAVVAMMQFAVDRVNALHMSRRVDALISDIGEATYPSGQPIYPE